MIRLPEGTTKYLLIDHKVVERNAQRRRAAAPVAVVYNVQEDGQVVRYIGHSVNTSGPAELSYAPHNFVVARHRDKHRAAYSTTSAVSVAETEQEATGGDYGLEPLTAPATAPEPKAPKTKAKTSK